MGGNPPKRRHRRLKMQGTGVKKSKKILIISTLFSLIAGITLAQDEIEALPPSSQSSIDFRLALRELWQYQVTWTRSYIVSVVSDLDDVAVVEDKLVKNQEKIGNAVKPYYGGMAGNRLAMLLREHIVIATEIIKASKNGSAEELEKAKKKGQDNADEIAALLKRAENPLWDKQTLKDVFYKHLEYVAMQADLRLKKDWPAEIKAYDDGLKHVLLLADLLAEGIVKQFPDKFKE